MYDPGRTAIRHVAPYLRSRSHTHRPCGALTICSSPNLRRPLRPSDRFSTSRLNATPTKVDPLYVRACDNGLIQSLELQSHRALSTVGNSSQSHGTPGRARSPLDEDVKESGKPFLGDGIEKQDNRIAHVISEDEVDLQQNIPQGQYGQNDTAENSRGDHQSQSDFLNVLTEDNAMATYTYTDTDSDAWEPHRVPATRPKADLSYHAVRKREAATLTDGLTITPRTIPSAFRDRSGTRRILWQYKQHLEPLLKSSARHDIENRDMDHWLSTIFSKETIHYLRRSGYSVEDVTSWSWIFDADTVDLSIRRYIVLAMKLRQARQIPMPLFIPLQLLRAEHIDSRGLTLFIQEFELMLRDGSQWDKESGSILLIRLLRQARLNNASFYERIAELAPRILSSGTQQVRGDEVQRLTHFYNRFLSLLALPLPHQPFLSVAAQQRAQLKIARSMSESQPQILLNREGYRALARLQLMHEKTSDEQRWSSVKAPSWPPWRRDELGIDARIEYPGRQSRVAKVIRRLLEAGYGPESMEREAQILAGWDIDKSPTIQVRKLLQRRPLSWIKSIFKEENVEHPEVDHHVWAARVAATRSVREAWVCFYSYMEATANQKRQLSVYHEMFHKLFARVQQTDQRFSPSPGDGKEVYLDPASPRDLVYVPKEPPTITELYGQMLQDGIRPAGRLLANLIDSGRTLKASLDYVKDSTLSEVKKDVLLHPEKYPRYFIRNVFSTLPDYLLASFVGSLTKHHKTNEVELFWPAAKSVEERGALPPTRIKPLYHGMALMQIWKPRYVPAYHAVLEGICTQAMTRRASNAGTPLRQYSYSELWTTTRQLLCLLREGGIAPDLVCFRKLVVLARNHTIRAPDQFTGKDLSVVQVVSMIKSLFAQSVDGYVQGNKLILPDKMQGIKAQPYWKDVEALILNLGFASDFDAVVDLLKWLQEQKDLLDCVDDGGYKMQRIACAARVALEATWAERPYKHATHLQIRQSKSYIERWGWPEKVDIDEFLKQHAVWFGGMRAAIKQP